MNLGHQAKLLGFTPLLYGNIKSLLDHYRTPQTQEKFAREHWQRPKMVTSFADGTKISYEMASLANATGFTVSVRGMQGVPCKRVEEATNLFSYEELRKQGRVDYILGAEPSFGVFILAESRNPIKQRYMNVYKMGDGPLYLFYDHCHLSPLESPRSIAAAALFHDATLAPIRPVCDVVTMAKHDLKKGDVLDGIGGFASYGSIDNMDVFIRDNLLPMGLSDGCTVLRDIPKDTAITFADVSIPKGRLCDELYAKQRLLFQL
jgi:predicted homoserine dehydrogenase-like protein